MTLVSHLSDLAISRFRAFRRLEVEGLSHVNLVVGANNSGKSSLLEALHLYFLQGSRTRILDLLLAREEFAFKRMRSRSFSSRDFTLAYESLFFGRPSLDSKPTLRIGPAHGGLPDLQITFAWLREISEELEGTVRLRTVRAAPGDELDVLPGLEISFGDRQTLVSLDRLDRDGAYRPRSVREPELPVVFLPSSGLGREEMGRLWDTVALTDDEATIIDTLRAISPSIEKIVLVQTPSARASSRTLMVKLEEFPDPVPFKSLGEGIEHLLSVSLALIKARNGVILIDEIENGIHYSVQPTLWQMVFKQARNWNTQVFATTHSWDCVEGFQLAASYQSSSSLFRLERKGGDIRAVQFLPREIEIARRESIEVR